MQEGTSNLFLLFFSWWYSYLPRRLYLAFSALSITLLDLFSVKAIFQTLFAPWKRDILSYEGLTLQQKFSVWTLNMSSRFIGFLIKISVLFVFIVFYLISIIIFFASFLLWIAFPLAILALMIIGFVNLGGGI
jgi:hypothetical protein